MNLKRIILAAVLIVAVSLPVLLRPKAPGISGERYRIPLPPQSTNSEAQAEVQEHEPVVNPQSVSQLPKVKCKLSEFTGAERGQLEKDFQEKYRPAIQRWCDAYKGRVPFDPYDVTLDNFAERIFSGKPYSEFIWVVDGITLGVRDSTAAGVRVDYLNAPQQTGKMMILPDGSQPPILTLPVTRDDVQQMLQADGWEDTNEWMEIIPSGLSGSLNGGEMVHVGGNPDNAVTWKYDLVFGPDGKLAYYLRGLELPRRN